MDFAEDLQDLPPPYTPTDPNAPLTPTTPSSGPNETTLASRPSLRGGYVRQNTQRSSPVSEALPASTISFILQERGQPARVPSPSLRIPRNIHNWMTPENLYAFPFSSVDSICRDITLQDWDTFANYICTSLGTNHKSLSSPLYPLLQLSSEKLAQKRVIAEQVTAEWNEAFWQPRGVKIEIAFEAPRRSYSTTYQTQENLASTLPSRPSTTSSFAPAELPASLPETYDTSPPRDPTTPHALIHAEDQPPRISLVPTGLQTNGLPGPSNPLGFARELLGGHGRGGLGRPHAGPSRNSGSRHISLNTGRGQSHGEHSGKRHERHRGSSRHNGRNGHQGSLDNGESPIVGMQPSTLQTGSTRRRSNSVSSLSSTISVESTKPTSSSDSEGSFSSFDSDILEESDIDSIRTKINILRKDLIPGPNIRAELQQLRREIWETYRQQKRSSGTMTREDRATRKIQIKAARSDLHALIKQARQEIKAQRKQKKAEKKAERKARVEERKAKRKSRVEERKLQRRQRHGCGSSPQELLIDLENAEISFAETGKEKGQETGTVERTFSTTAPPSYFSGHEKAELEAREQQQVSLVASSLGIDDDGQSTVYSPPSGRPPPRNQSYSPPRPTSSHTDRSSSPILHSEFDPAEPGLYTPALTTAAPSIISTDGGILTPAATTPTPGTPLIHPSIADPEYQRPLAHHEEVQQRAAEDRAIALARAAEDRENALERVMQARELASAERQRALDRAAADRTRAQERAARDRDRAAAQRDRALQRAAEERERALERAARDRARAAAERDRALQRAAGEREGALQRAEESRLRADENRRESGEQKQMGRNSKDVVTAAQDLRSKTMATQQCGCGPNTRGASPPPGTVIPPSLHSVEGCKWSGKWCPWAVPPKHSQPEVGESSAQGAQREAWAQWGSNIGNTTGKWGESRGEYLGQRGEEFGRGAARLGEGFGSQMANWGEGFGNKMAAWGDGFGKKMEDVGNRPGGSYSTPNYADEPGSTLWEYGKDEESKKETERAAEQNLPASLSTTTAQGYPDEKSGHR